MIRQMGIKPKRSLYKTELSPKQKVRAVAYVVMAAVRMGKLSSEWKEQKKIREALEPAKEELRMRMQLAKIG